MPRSVRTHMRAEAQQVLLPKHLTKQEFGKRLYNLMLDKGWNQSELARRSNLNRDAISTYVNGRALPTPVSLGHLCRALGVKPEDLLPNYVESAIEADAPALEIRVSTSAPDMAWLRANQLVSLQAAVKIAEILHNDAIANRERGSKSPSVQHVEGETPETERGAGVYTGPSLADR